MNDLHSPKFLARLVAVLLLLPSYAPAREPKAEVAQLLQTTGSWDGTQYGPYPTGQPQITVLRIRIPANTSLDWHLHPVISAGYVLSGTLYLEKKATGEQKEFHAGEALTEMVQSVHRGFTKSDPVELVVFYAGQVGVPITVVQNQ
jgi:quercetin dioxygenase-like cupin family protein